MSIPFNPQRPQDSALNAVMAGAMGTGAGKTITFDRPPDKQFSNGEGVSGFEDKIKAYKTGASIIEQLNGKGKISSAVASDSAFFTLETDLLTVRPDNLYKIQYILNLTSFVGTVSRYVWWVRGSKTIVPTGATLPSDMILLTQIFRNANNSLRAFFFLRNTSGSLVQLAAIDPITPILGQDIVVSIEKDASNYVFVLGPHTSSVAVELVQVRANHFFTDGGPLTINNDWTNLRDDMLLS